MRVHIGYMFGFGPHGMPDVAMLYFLAVIKNLLSFFVDDKENIIFNYPVDVARQIHLGVGDSNFLYNFTLVLSYVCTLTERWSPLVWVYYVLQAQICFQMFVTLYHHTLLVARFYFAYIFNLC